MYHLLKTEMVNRHRNRLIIFVDNSDGENENERTDKRNVLKFREDVSAKNKPKPFFFSGLGAIEIAKDNRVEDYLNNFKIINLIDEGIAHLFRPMTNCALEYPIQPKKSKEGLTVGKSKYNPEAVNDPNVMRELLLNLHGEFAKPGTIRKTNEKYCLLLFCKFNTLDSQHVRRCQLKERLMN